MAVHLERRSLIGADRKSSLSFWIGSSQSRTKLVLLGRGGGAMLACSGSEEILSVEHILLAAAFENRP